MAEKPKKPGFFQKLFGSSKDDDYNTSPSSPNGSGQKDKKHHGESSRKPSTSPVSPTAPKPSSPSQANPPSKTSSSSSSGTKSPSASAAGPPSKQRPSGSTSSAGAGGDSQRKSTRPTGGAKKSRRRKGGKKGGVLKVDINQPLEFPTTPEMILSHHKARPFLNKNEEWLLVELNEFECLVDSIDIIKVIAKHSQFFEVEPDELWEQFFEYVEELNSYDEVINFDVWQEFRDEKYSC